MNIDKIKINLNSKRNALTNLKDRFCNKIHYYFSCLKKNKKEHFYNFSDYECSDNQSEEDELINLSSDNVLTKEEIIY